MEIEALAVRYFQMWNSGDTSAVTEIVGPDWVDHGHPEVTGPADVAASVAAIRAARPALHFRIDAVLSAPDRPATARPATDEHITDPDVTDRVAVVGAATSDTDPDGGTRLVWLFAARDGRLAELRTFRDTAP